MQLDPENYSSWKICAISAKKALGHFVVTRLTFSSWARFETRARSIYSGQ